MPNFTSCFNLSWWLWNDDDDDDDDDDDEGGRGGGGGAARIFLHKKYFAMTLDFFF